MHRSENIGLDTGPLHDRAILNVRGAGLALGGVCRAAQRWPRGRRRAPDGEALTSLPRLVAAGRISCHQRVWLAVGNVQLPVRACAVDAWSDCECALRQALEATSDLQPEFFTVAERASVAGRSVALGAVLGGQCPAVLRGLRDIKDALVGAVAEGVERVTLNAAVDVALGDMRQLDAAARERDTAVEARDVAEPERRPVMRERQLEARSVAREACVAVMPVLPDLRHAGSDIALWQETSVKTHGPLGPRTETNRDTASDAMDARAIGHGGGSRLHSAESGGTRQRAVVSSLPDQTDAPVSPGHPASVAGWGGDAATDSEKRRRRLILVRSHLDRFSAEAPSAASAGPVSRANANASDKAVALTTIHQNTEQRCCDAA